MPSKKTTKKNADLGEQFWVRDGKAEHLAFLVQNVEARSGEVYIQWYDRGDREFVPEAAILRSVFDDQPMEGGRERRNRRRRSIESNAADAVDKEILPHQVDQGRDTQKENSQPTAANEEMKEGAPLDDKKARKLLSSKRRLPQDPPASLKRQALKEVQIMSSDDRGQDDDISEITEEGRLASSSSVEFEFRGSKKSRKPKKWHLKASSDKKQKKGKATRKSTKYNIRKKPPRLFRPSTYNIGGKQNMRPVQQPRSFEVTSGDPFEFSETSLTILPIPTNNKGGSHLCGNGLETPCAEVKKEQLPLVTASKTAVQKRSICVERNQCLESTSFSGTTTGCVQSALNPLSCDSLSRKKKTKRNADDQNSNSTQSFHPSETKHYLEGENEENLHKSSTAEECDGGPMTTLSLATDSQSKTEVAQNVILLGDDDKTSKGAERKAQSPSDGIGIHHRTKALSGDTMEKLKDSPMNEAVVYPSSPSIGFAFWAAPVACDKAPVYPRNDSLEYRDDSKVQSLEASPIERKSLQHRRVNCLRENEDHSTREDKKITHIESPQIKRDSSNTKSWIPQDTTSFHWPFSGASTWDRTGGNGSHKSKINLGSPLSRGLSTGEHNQFAERISTDSICCYQRETQLYQKGSELIASQERSEADGFSSRHRVDDGGDGSDSDSHTASTTENYSYEKLPLKQSDISIYGLAKSIYLESPDIDSADTIEILEDHLNLCLSEPLKKTLEEYLTKIDPAVDKTEYAAACTGPLDQMSAKEQKLELFLDAGVAPVLHTLQSKWLDRMITHVSITTNTKATFSLDGMNSLFIAIAALPNVQALTVSLGGNSLPVREFMKAFKFGARILKLELIDAVISGQDEDFCITAESDYNFSALQELQLVGCSPYNHAMTRALETWLLELIALAPALEKIWLDGLQGITREAITKIIQYPNLTEIGLRCLPIPRDIFTLGHLERVELIDYMGFDTPTFLLPTNAITLRTLFLWGELQEQIAASFFFLLHTNAALENISMTVSGGASFSKLRLDLLLQANTTLRHFDLIVLGGIDDIDEGALCIVKALLHHPSIETFRIFTGGSHLVSDTVKARITRLLSSNDTIKALRLCGIEHGEEAKFQSEDWSRDDKPACYYPEYTGPALPPTRHSDTSANTI